MDTDLGRSVFCTGASMINGLVYEERELLMGYIRTGEYDNILEN